MVPAMDAGERAQPRPALRVTVTVATGLLLGAVGTIVGIVVTGVFMDGRGDTLVLLPVAAGFFGGIAGGVALAARATRHWALHPPAAPSGLDLGPAPPPADMATSDEMTRLVRMQPRTGTPPALLLLGSLLLFLVTSGGASVTHLLVLAGVLAFHEAGHAVAMRAFGYSDVRVFFIPFFGAATSGRRNAGPAWRDGVVLLLGPVPGIVAGAVLSAFVDDTKSTLGYTASTLAILNGFNLLPVLPLDGGRLFELVIFGRHRLAAAGASLLSAAAFVAWGASDQSLFLAAIGVFQLYGMWTTWHVGKASDGLRAGGKPLPARVEEASEAVVDETNRRLDSRLGRKTTAARASWLRVVLERAIDAQRSPGLGGSTVLLGAWLCSVVLALIVIAETSANGG